MKFLVTFILKVHLEDARRKKECYLSSGYFCLKFRAGRFEHSIDRYCRDVLKVSFCGVHAAKVKIKTEFACGVEYVVACL